MTKMLILTGFLGSGKTTTLNNLLKNSGKEKLAVIINEFAAVGIDGKIVNSDGMEVRELSNGCVCCTKSKELEETIQSLRKKYQPDTIILETTGVATLKPIINIALRENVQVKGVITVIDAFRGSKTENFGKVTTEQIKLSSTVIVNKIDMVSKEQVNEIISKIRQINPVAKILSCTMGSVRLDQISTDGPTLTAHEHVRGFAEKLLIKLFPKLGLDKTSKHLSKSGVGSVSFETYAKIDRRKFYDLIDTFSTKVYRAKGILNFADSEKSYVFNYASGLVMIEEGRKASKTSLVIIGKFNFFEKLQWLSRFNDLKQKADKTNIAENLLNIKYFLKSA